MTVLQSGLGWAGCALALVGVAVFTWSPVSDNTPVVASVGAAAFVVGAFDAGVGFA